MSLITTSIGEYKLQLNVKAFRDAVLKKLKAEGKHLDGVPEDQINANFAELASRVEFTLEEINADGIATNLDTGIVNGGLDVANFAEEAIKAINSEQEVEAKTVFFARETLQSEGIIPKPPVVNPAATDTAADSPAGNNGTHWGWKVGTGVISALLLLIGGSKWEESFGKGAVLLGVVGAVATALWAGAWTSIQKLWNRENQGATAVPAEQPGG